MQGGPLCTPVNTTVRINMAHSKPLWTSLSMHRGYMQKPSWLCVIPLFTSLDYYILLCTVLYAFKREAESFPKSNYRYVE